MSASDSDTDPLVALAEEFAARIRLGERPALSEYIERYPEHADRIRQLFPPLAVLEDLGSVGGPQVATSAGWGREPRRLGDYRILREVGRGGMGIVYEAEQVSLGRRVALKVLPDHAAGDARRLVRFRREARAAARLHHTNIVPVFEVGQHDNDSYYAMQFIPGQGLDRVIEELQRLRGRRVPGRPDPLAVAGRIGPPGPVASGPADGVHDRSAPPPLAGRLAVASTGDATPTTTGTTGPIADMTPARLEGVAIEGVATDPIGMGATPDLHSEWGGASSAVFPGGSPLSDLGLGRGHPVYLGIARIGLQVAQALAYAHARGVVHRNIKPSNLLLDGSGVVWVADFGLAKAEEDGLTEPGDLLGTLRYMSPERFQGEADGRADIYALGLSLYELLTLRPAFDAVDRARLIEQVKQADPARPRSITPQIPRDLETIVLKSIERDPRRRYQAAEEMAEDLRRFLDGEPIRARPVSPWARAALWARRRPAEAALAAVGLLAALVSVGMVVSLWYGDRLQESLYRQRIATAGLAWRDGNFGRLEQLLDSCPEEYRGLWEWRYLKRQCHPERLLLPGHGGGVYHLAWSRDGERVAAACFGGTVELWDAAAGRRIFAFKAHAGDALGVAFSPDGTRLVTAGSDGVVLLWDAATGRATRLAGPGPRPIWDVASSPDGARFATAESGGFVRLRDAATGRVEAEIRTPGSTGDVYKVAFSPDGRTLAFGGADQPITLWDLEADEEAGILGTRREHTAATLGLAFSPADGRLLAESGTNGMVRLWDVAGRRVARELPGHAGDVYGVAFSQDGGRIATASGDPGVRIWDVESGRCLHSLTGHAATVFDVAYRGDGARLATASQDRTVRLWDPSAEPSARVLRGHDGPVNAVAFRPGGDLLASAGDDGTVRLWGTSATPSQTLGGHDGPVTSLAFDAGGRLLASADKGGAVRVWDLSTARPTGRLLVDLDAEATGLAFYPDGRRLAVSCADGSVRSYVVGTGRLSDAHPGHLGAARGLAFGGGGRVLATGGEDRTVILRDATTGRALHPPLRGHGCWVHAVAFAPDGRTLTSGGGPAPDATAAGRLASASGDGEIRIWDVASGREVRAIRAHGNFVRGVAFHPDGSRIATAGMDRAVKLWDAATGEEVLTLLGHEAGVLGVAFSPDGERLASAGADGIIRVWDPGR